MYKLARSDLMSLETYSEKREKFRANIIEHKKNRQLRLGNHSRLSFESKKTIQYQIQEVLYIEKTFNIQEVEEELKAYNPLIPDGSNLKATFMLEYPDVEERTKKTLELRGIEHTVWLQVGNDNKVYPTANDRLKQHDGSRTATVHFFCYEFTPAMIAALKNGHDLYVGINHQFYSVEPTKIPTHIRNSLINDFDACGGNIDRTGEEPNKQS